MPMRQLRKCDFCGGDAAGVYEVLPPELSPTEAEQRRVVLCSNCVGTLETVVDPLLERLGVGTDDDASAADIGGEPEGRSVASEVSVGGDDGADAESENPGGSPTDPASGSDHDEGPIAWDGSDPAGDDRSDDAGLLDDPDPASTGMEPETEMSEPVAGDPDGADAGGTGADAVGGNGSDIDDGGAGTDVDDGGGADANIDGDPASDNEPEDFRTVMRLLGNREFPVERDAIVELATSAYELDDRHVHRIVDHAVERGVIVDDGGTLRRD